MGTTTQEAFHSMRGHVADGQRVLCGKDGRDVLTVRGVINGWVVERADGTPLAAPTRNALEVVRLVAAYSPRAARKSKRFVFKEALVAMLLRLGARPSERFYDYVIDTRAGLLYLSAYDDWLAARFEDVEKARQVVKTGCLNRFSGKWNWHFVFAEEQDVEFLEQQIRDLLPGEVAA